MGKQKGLTWNIQLSQIWHPLLVTFLSLGSFFLPLSAWLICQLQQQGFIVSIPGRWRGIFLFNILSNTAYSSLTQYSFSTYQIIQWDLCECVFVWMGSSVFNVCFELCKGQLLDWKASCFYNVPMLESHKVFQLAKWIRTYLDPSKEKSQNHHCMRFRDEDCYPKRVLWTHWSFFHSFLHANWAMLRWITKARHNAQVLIGSNREKIQPFSL